MSKNYEDPLTEYLVLQIKLDIDVRAKADDNRETILNPSSHQQMRRRRKRKNSTSLDSTQLSAYNQPKHIPDIDRRGSHRMQRPAQEEDKQLQLYADWLTRCDQIGEALDIYAFVASHYSDRCIPLAQLKALSSTVIDYISSTSATAAKTASLPPSRAPPPPSLSSLRRAPPASSSSRSMDDGYTIIGGGAAAAMEPSLNANAVSCDRLQDRVRYSKNKRIQRYWKDGGGGGGGGGGAASAGLYDDDHGRFCDALLSDLSEVDPLLCPICKDILRYPVTANCGHSFCRDCCDSATMCTVCRVKFPASSCPPTAATAAVVSSEFSSSSSSSSSSMAGGGLYTSNSNTNASQYMDFAQAAAAAVTDRGGALVPEIDNTNTNSLLHNHSHAGGISNDNHSHSANNNSMKFMPDVLVRRLVEKWWGADLQARTINERAASFISLNLLDDALTFCNASLENHPNNFNSLLLRAEVLRKLNHYQSSLADIDHALRIKSSSARAHYHRSLALCGLGRFDEALVAQCVAISLDDKNSMLSSTELFQHDLAKLLQKLLAQSPKKIHLNSSPTSAPYDIVPESRRRRKQIGLPNGFNGDNTIHAGAPTDCDLLRQGSRKHCRRKSYGRKQKQEVQVNFFGSTRFECVLERAQQEVQRIRESESDVERAQQHLLPVNPNLIDPTDFDCVLCCRTLWKPVVTPCGHTYCWVCLDRSMYYSPSCPLCMSPLVEQHVKVLQGSSSPVPFMLAKRPVTKFLEAAMKRFIPERYEKRFRQEMNQESSVPLFICTTAFPHVPCPLFVYEPRYRLMVRRAVESGKKQFGIVQSHSGKSRYFDVGTILDIRDCVLLGDGCSILSTIGCKRFRILARNEKDGYDTAKVEYIYDEIITEDNVSFISSMHASVLSKAIEWYKSLGTKVKEEILRSFGEMPAVEENWESIADGPAWAWWIIALLPLNQQLKVDILATTSLEKRLRAIEKTLDCMSGNFKRSNQSCVVVHREGIQPCQAVECCQRSSSELSSSSDSHTTSEHSQLML